MTEAASRCVLLKKVFLEISARASFLKREREKERERERERVGLLYQCIIICPLDFTGNDCRH